MDAVDAFGLWTVKGPVVPMNAQHRHHEIEFNFVYSGAMTYLHSGTSLQVKAGQVLLFWGAMPHGLIEIAPDTVCGWLYVPLPTLLRFALPALHARLLQGVPVLTELETLDLAVFERWLAINENPTRHSVDTVELTPAALEQRKIIELEVEAFLRRLAMNLPQSVSAEPTKTKAAELAQYVSEHYLKMLSLKDMAGAVGLAETYASNLFKKTFSLTLTEYLTQHRVAHAQRLLATTDMSVLDVAFASGFGSSSQFYTSFKRLCGRSPSAFRRSLPRALVKNR